MYLEIRAMKTFIFSAAALALAASAQAGQVVTGKTCVVTQGLCVVLGGGGSNGGGITGNPAPAEPEPDSIDL